MKCRTGILGNENTLERAGFAGFGPWRWNPAQRLEPLSRLSQFAILAANCSANPESAGRSLPCSRKVAKTSSPCLYDDRALIQTLTRRARDCFLFEARNVQTSPNFS